jgi:hypothetical protein
VYFHCVFEWGCVFCEISHIITSRSCGRFYEAVVHLDGIPHIVRPHHNGTFRIIYKKRNIGIYHTKPNAQKKAVIIFF